MSGTRPRSLCHPDGLKSCGACCGLYNRAPDTGGTPVSRATTLSRLREQTLAFRRDADVADPENLRAFRARWEVDASKKLLGDLPVCPFLGLLDLHGDTPDDDGAAAGRIGCLVHPLQNDGIDGRDCGVYDRFICEDYLCASHRLLRAKEIALVQAAVDDSYLYGLVITDVRFVRALLDLAADRNGMEPSASSLQLDDAVTAAADYFRLKVDWPWAADDGVFGQLTAGEGLDTPRRPDPSSTVGERPDRLEPVLRCLGTHVTSPEALAAARDAVRDRVDAFALAVAPE